MTLHRRGLLARFVMKQLRRSARRLLFVAFVSLTILSLVKLEDIAECTKTAWQVRGRLQAGNRVFPSQVHRDTSILQYTFSKESGGSETHLPQTQDEPVASEDPDWELDLYEIPWGSLENYQVRQKLGMSCPGLS